MEERWQSVATDYKHYDYKYYSSIVVVSGVAQYTVQPLVQRAMSLLSWVGDILLS